MYFRPSWPARVSATAAHAAMSRVSMNGILPSPEPPTIRPSRTITGAWASRFCMNICGRRIVHRMPDAMSAASASQ